MKFEIAPKKTEIDCDWYTAVMYCFTLGPGWRLPTFSELVEMKSTNYDFCDSRGYGNWYWSSTQSPHDYNGYRDSVLTFNMEHDRAGDLVKHVDGNTVRAVRDLC